MLENVVATETRDDLLRRLLQARIDHAYRLATFILHDRLAAEDAVQEAALLAWRRRGTLRDAGTADGWFTRIIVNVCRDELRRRSRQPHLVEMEAAVLPASRGAGPMVGPAIARLTPDQQALLALRYGEDLSVPQIAERLGLPDGTVKSRLHATLQHLRAAIDAEGRSEETRR
ncbi:MAG: hypothetical protein HY263_06930 [Chloroflexi bacterium]|nr:hypothetical protein [Chloroflexota bacterium]